MWRRRATYDPMKAAAEGRKKQEDAKKAVQSSKLDRYVSINVSFATNWPTKINHLISFRRIRWNKNHIWFWIELIERIFHFNQTNWVHFKFFLRNSKVEEDEIEPINTQTNFNSLAKPKKKTKNLANLHDSQKLANALNKSIEQSKYVNCHKIDSGNLRNCVEPKTIDNENKKR